MTRAAELALLLALPLAGCSLSGAGLAPSSFAQNQCKTDDDCPGARCHDGACLGSDGSLNALLVTVTPPSTLSGIKSLAYYFSYATPGNYLPASGGALDLPLAQGVELNGTVSIDLSSSVCSPTPIWNDVEAPGSSIQTSMAGYIPADVTFTPSAHPHGVPQDSYRSALAEDAFHFQQTVPPGNYDVYVTPHYPLIDGQISNTDCQVPPRLILNQPVTSSLDFNMPASSKMKVDVTWALPDVYTDVAAQSDAFFVNPLAGWRLDLVEPKTGRLLSVSEPVDTTLKMPPVNPDTTVTYEVTLAYSPVYDVVKGVYQPTPISGDILRLTPPATDPRDGSPYTAPVFLAQLDGALVDAGGEPAPAHIVQPSILPAPVHVEFQTALAADGSSVPSNVFLRATSIDGIAGLSISFWRSVSVGADGIGAVDLLPGRYHVSATATQACSKAPCLGTVETDWVVGRQPANQAGKLVEFEPRTTYEGYAYVYRGPAAGASVNLVASPLIFDTSVLNVGDGAVAPVPQSTSGAVDSSGYFSFAADAGTFDLRVEPDPSTNYGWFVRPGFVLPGDQDALAELDVELPISYKGKVTATTFGGTVPVAGALIRAYAYVKANGTPAVSADEAAAAVQVAETYSDDASGDPGAFTLLIPPSLVTP
jgi:hypothetical protein